MSTQRRRSTPPRAAPLAAASGETSKARVDCVDTARGFAIAMMFAYHFCFDLNYFDVLKQDFYHDARWIAWRTVILSSFLLLVGIGLSLSHTARWSWPRYWKRLAQIAGCAGLVSIGSYLAFPDSWIYFGVLHHIVLASVLALPFLSAPRVALALSLTSIALGAGVQHAFFDAKPWHWFGLMTFKPRTEDYVPLLPWFGVVLAGVGLGHYLAQPAFRARLAAWRAQTAFARASAWAGRHSLLLYMLHQPIFIGVLTLVLGLPRHR
jgi:uncharacterized membrane protein